MKMSPKKVLGLLRVVASTLLAAVLLASVVYIAADEALSRMQRAALRAQCQEVLSERAMMMMGAELSSEVEAQVIMQCRQAIP